MKIILIITVSYDLAADYFIETHSDKADFFRINTDFFHKYNFVIYNDRIIIEDKNRKVNLKEIFGIYYRKIDFPDLKDYEEKYHYMMKKEILHLLEGIIESFEGKVLTRPSILKRSENKIVQLELAEKIGFKIPKSIISNFSESVFKKISEKEVPWIVKPLSLGKFSYNGENNIIQTNIISVFNKEENIEKSPEYFQEYIPKEYELRITIIKKCVYCVKIISEDKIDWRKDYLNLRYELIDIPERIKEKCFKMMEKLNLDFGAFDFIFDGKDYYFLEINPNGQWLWLEETLDLDISKKIIKYFLGD